MSTLSVSLVALVVLVIVGVALFNFWQSRGSSGRERALFGAGGRSGGGRRGRDDYLTEPEQDDDAVGRAPRGAHGRRRPAAGEDFNDWTRERREPTFTVDEDDATPARTAATEGMRADPPAGSRRRGQDGPAPAGARQAAAATAAIFPATAPGMRGDHATERPGSATHPTDSGRHDGPGRLADDWEVDAEDLGPPEFEAPRLEPVPVEPPPPDTPTIRAGAFEQTQPFAEQPSEQPEDPEAPEEGEKRSTPDYLPAQVDHLVTLIPRSPVNAERLIALTSSLRHVGSKPIRIEIDDGKGRWVPLQSGTMVGCLRCSVLLANRQGPLNAVELSDFSASVESLAAQIGARYVAADMNQVLREARDLDSVAARLDTQVELGVESAEPVTPDRLASVARKLDLYDRGGNRYACFAQNGDLLYLMTPGATMDMIAFVLDVPRTAQSHDPWRSMVACASSCAQLVRGRVVDSAGRGMSVSMIETVGQQIARRYAELAETGLKAGAPATLRVFN
ncbi:MAG: hypothetical protein GX652_15030 [Burkholderiaceae bacterium]|nr:hypothetical protein [Burkholderiaceae bacterium]